MAGFALDSYLAGLFDGEGTITVAVNSKRQSGWTQIRASVHMTDRAVLKLFAKRFGGSVIYEKHKERPGYKPIYRWNICGRNAVPALEVFSQFCVIKAAQAKLALEAISLLCKGGKTRVTDDNLERRFSLAKEVARLKRIPVDDALGV